VTFPPEFYETWHLVILKVACQILSSAKTQGQEILSQTLYLNCLNVDSKEESAPDEANSE
jgi:hypothetical protein